MTPRLLLFSWPEPERLDLGAVAALDRAFGRLPGEAVVVLRWPGASPAELASGLAALRAATGRGGVGLGVRLDASTAAAAAALVADTPALLLHLADGPWRDDPAVRRGLRAAGSVAITAAVHDAAAASGAGFDALVLSPVLPTASKPGQQPLGLAGLRAAVAGAQAPVLALGGVGPGELAAVLEAGAAGAAALSAAWREPAERWVAALISARRAPSP